MARSKSRAHQQSGTGAFPARQILIGAGVGTALFFAFITVAALAVLKSGAGRQVYPLAGFASAGIAAFIGGFAAVRPLRRNGVPYGGLTGLAQAFAACVAAFAANGCKAGVRLLLLAAVTVLMACVGGIIAANVKKRIRI